MAISRRDARELLLNLVFEYLFLEDKNSISLNEILNNKEISAENKDFINNAFEGIIKEFEPLDQIIKLNTKDFSLSQIFKLDYAILLIACFEIIYQKQQPAIAINEAVNLAKKFSTDKSSSFVNGVLSSVAKGL